MVFVIEARQKKTEKLNDAEPTSPKPRGHNEVKNLLQFGVKFKDGEPRNRDREASSVSQRKYTLLWGM